MFNMLKHLCSLFAIKPKPFKIIFISGNYQRQFLIDKIEPNEDIKIELGSEFIVNDKKTFGFELRKIKSK